MNEGAIVKFNFRGDDLNVVGMREDVGVALRPLCDEVFGINFDGQRRRLQRAADLGTRWACVVVTTTQVGGQRRDVLVLPRASLPMFTATIDASRVRPEIRPKLIAYQNEAADVLAAHFLKPRHAGLGSSERLEQIEGRLAAIEAPLGQLVQWLEEQRARERKRNPGPRLQPPRVGAAPRIDPAALAAFLATRPDGEQIAAAELFQQYLRWCRSSGAEPVTLTMFGRQIMASGEYRRTETKGGRIYTRILFS